MPARARLVIIERVQTSFLLCHPSIVVFSWGARGLRPALSDLEVFIDSGGHDGVSLHRLPLRLCMEDACVEPDPRGLLYHCWHPG